MTAEPATSLGGGLLAFLVTAVLVLVLRPLALEIGLADEPGGRKRHAARVPVIGGIAMALGLSFGSSLASVPAFWGIAMLAAWLLVGVGAIDDRFDLPPAVRLLAQAVAALAVVLAGGVVVRELGESFLLAVPLGPIGPLFTVLVIVTLVNGFNLIDGIDGLAGGVAFLSLAALAALGAGTDVFGAAVVLTMAVAGFLMFNLPLRSTQALRVFMGDAGSTVLGFAIACLAIVLTQREGPSVAPVVMLWILALPVYELLAAMWRRLREGRSPWAADDRHLHHALLARGISPRRTLAFMLLLGATFAAVGLAGHWARLPEPMMLAGWLAGGVLYYRITRRPRPVAKWVRSWKACETSFEATFVEPAPAQAGGRKGGD